MNAIVENFRLIAARECAARKWRVFPLHHPMIGPTSCRCSCPKPDCSNVGKHPRTENGLHDADDDPDMIAAWWAKFPAANLGIATGQVSGIYVVDIDPKHGGDVSWQELIAAYGEIPPTPVVETGGGGQHIYFRAPTRTMRNTSGKLGAGIDTRGDGGYVVAPPSLHESRMRYVWRTSPHESTLADMPAWLLALLVDPPKRDTNRVPTARDGAGQHWLGRALAMAQVGKRNETGLWLACQLRDGGIGEGEAETILRDYADRAPRGDKPYSETEALASLRSAYSRPPRDAAKSEQPKLQSRTQPASLPAPTPVETEFVGAAAELGEFLEGVVDGRIVCVPWPWPTMTRITQALIPGTTTVVVGDPGVGKTFFVLECLLFWLSFNVDAVCYFIEKNRRFHMMRLLAQLEGCGHFLNFEWLRTNGNAVIEAMARHDATIDRIGKHVYSSDGKPVTLDQMLAWVRQMASAGKRIIMIDPITAADAGSERWEADRRFMLAAEHIATEHGASILLVTHPRKGNRPGAPTGHDAAGGAAYFRLCDTLIWLNRPKKPRRVIVFQSGRPSFTLTPDLFFSIHKARNGKGTNQEIAFTFADGLKFAEQGIVESEARESGDE